MYSENSIQNDIKQEDIPIILRNMKNVCKIKMNYGFSIGFFCKFPFYDKNYPSPSLIMNNSCLGKNVIEYYLKDDDLPKLIKIDFKRRVFLNKKHNFAIIEIKPEDNLETNSFLNIDDEDFKPDDNNKIKLVYLLGNKEYSLCKLIKDYYNITLKKDNTFKYDIDGPIINLSNHKVWGIYKYTVLSMETIIEKYKEENGKVNEINSDIIRINYNINNIPKNCDKLLLMKKNKNYANLLVLN